MTDQSATTRRPGRPRGGDSAKVRAQILVAATELIGRQGYGATSMAQVAQAADISPTGLNHHFGSKTALLAAVLERRDTEDQELLTGMGASWEAVDMMVALARRNMQRPAMVQLFTTLTGEATTPDHPAHEWVVTHYRRALNTVREGIIRDQQAGTIRADTPVDRLARQIVALMDGYQTQWLLDPSIDMAGLLADHVAELKCHWGTARSV